MGDKPRYRRPMTNEERITGIEDALIHLSNIMEFRFGLYANNTTDPRVVDAGEHLYGWVRSVQEHRAGT